MNQKKSVYNKFQMYSIADCDCKYCLHYGGRHRGEANCLVKECVCKEDRKKAFCQERGFIGSQN